MRKPRFQAALLAALSAAALSVGTAPAQGAASDPLFLYVPVPHPPIVPPPNFQPPPGPPPTGYLSGPCGLTVDPAGRFYLSDYYHDAVDVYSTVKDIKDVWRPSFQGQLLPKNPDGPCGLAIDASSSLYVNYYHHSVVKLAPPLYEVGAVIDSADPTGVAVDRASGDVYVDDRTYIARYEAPVEPGEEPAQKIGLGSLGDGYGIAVSAFPGKAGGGGLPPVPSTAGYLYVPDAADETVKVYDPATDVDDPVATIDGHETPNGGFVSLRDSAVAVDDASGEVYVADNLQPLYTERPQAAIHVFTPEGLYEGHLKYQVTDPLPPGLAVDNSGLATQGRVYVTSGNTAEAGVYGYPPGAATLGFSLPGWPVGGCGGIATCIETTGGSSPFALAPEAPEAPSSALAVAPSEIVGATADVERRRHRRAHRRQLRRHPHRVRAASGRGGR